MKTVSWQTQTRPQGRVFSGFRSQSGFTVVELVVVMVLMGILAANAMPHFFTANRFEEMGFADTTRGSLLYARKLALASRCDTRISIDAGGYQLWQRASACGSGNFTRAVQRPGGRDWAASAPNGIAVGNLDVFFDAAGRPHDHATSTLLTSARMVTIGSRSITLEPVTGFAH